MDVVGSADYNGSTEYIREMIANAPAGSKWAIGTEISLVNRLAAENPDKLVFLPGFGNLPLFHDVQDPPRVPLMGPGRPKRRRRRKPHRGRGRHGARGASRARPHAGSGINGPAH